MNTERKSVFYVPDDILVDIKVSGTFYKRIQALFVYLSQKVDQKDFLEIYAKVAKGNEPTNDYEFQLQTVFSLLLEIENVAKEKNLLKEESAEEFVKKVKEYVDKNPPSGN